MNDDTLRQLDSELTHLLTRMSQGQRRQLAKEITRDLRRSQIKRISQQKNPDGSPYTKRKANFITVQREIQFMWHGQKRTLRNWRGNSKTITGQDANKKAQRSFRKSDIQRYISIKKDKISTERKTKQTRMFKKLATARFLRAYNSDKEAVIYFLPSAANIAGVHQFGLTERIGNAKITYPSRQLLGLTPEEIRHIESQIIDFLSR
ncbi:MULTISPECIES: phage virion morphogenesis protein [Providencia]|uniref:Phage tail protein n=2 Tax=Providencia rettgeri TaxID=587 RepID=A0A264VRV5_PRORE|nr:MULTISPECIES: phage virion morphogenesis protein [Providencia]MBQ0371802.1 phage virion morphogenesis protein [Providencia rettgeri]MBQ0606099.1 phage virion morphogenesis protein [Providencia rettgeri]MBV2189023.1 phage virion morphogenesis protein [Providencia rettgeri]MCJ2222516.1 phage virion morphogenesis protein [Providencia rettgeri]MCK8629724.1 phage virion morphogenesis protein [Providencia rettgeri]